MLRIRTIIQNLKEMKWVLPGFDPANYSTEMEKLGHKYNLGL